MIVLRDYQSTLIDEARQSLGTHRSVMAVAPTGAGKTVMFSYIASRAVARGNRVGIFAHRAELLTQISNTLRRFSVPHAHIVAGQRLVQKSGCYVVSAPTYARNPERYPQFDLMIFDEAHHVTEGSTWHKCIDRSPDGKILGFSATPERLDGKPLTRFQTMVQGPTTRSLIAQGALCPYVMYSPPSGVDLTGVRRIGGDYKRDELSAAVDKPKITGDAVRHYRKYLDGRPSVAFCVSIAHAEHVAAEFRGQGYKACSVDGSMKPEQRKEIMGDFMAGRINVLTSCDLISEGFDCPGIFGAILLRPTQSLSLYLQQVGRALRTHDGKDRAVILDHVQNIQHGKPDDERQWSLEGREARRGPMERITTVKQCERCYAAYDSSAACCPECGWSPAAKERKIEQVDGELVEVTRESVPEIVLPGKASVSPAWEAKKREMAEAKKRAILMDWARKKKIPNPEAVVAGIMAKGGK